MDHIRAISPNTQRKHVERSRQHWLKSQFSAWSKKIAPRKPRIVPFEGEWQQPLFAQYDVVPGSVVPTQLPSLDPTNMNGSTKLQLDDDRITASVDNIVHTAYIAATPQKDNGKRKQIFTQLWLARRCMHLGFSENRVRATIEFSFRAPYTATDLFFMNGHVMCTGSPTREVAETMVNFLIDEICNVGGAKLTLQSFKSRNIVVTAKLPYNLLLPLMATQKRVNYNPKQFPGAVVECEKQEGEKRGVKMLTFAPGYIICVGANNLDRIKQAYNSEMAFFKRFEDTAENHELMKRALTVLPL